MALEQAGNIPAFPGAVAGRPTGPVRAPMNGYRRGVLVGCANIHDCLCRQSERVSGYEN